jgi:hypothetical protein
MREPEMHNTNETMAESNSVANRVARRDYAPPQLVHLGDVRDLTLGGSPGAGDSGNSEVQQPQSARSPSLPHLGLGGGLQGPP